MNTIETIAQRRSIRKFKGVPISDEAIETILNAASQAPSGKNRQPWKFIVIKQDHTCFWRHRNLALGRSGYVTSFMPTMSCAIGSDKHIR